MSSNFIYINFSILFLTEKKKKGVLHFGQLGKPIWQRNLSPQVDAVNHLLFLFFPPSLGVSITRYPVLFLGTDPGPGWTGPGIWEPVPAPVQLVPRFQDSVPKPVGNRFQDRYPVPWPVPQLGLFDYWASGDEFWIIICETLLTQEPSSCFWHQAVFFTSNKQFSDLWNSTPLDGRLESYNQTKYWK